ncbi:NAD(P)-binding protein [Thozetella sp. PMI_491]|nr:NAD(P)-binding protein [Thozetella sp. PMI_491]
MAAVFKAGHTALITGGASGIGLALAKKVSGYGLKVLVADWDDAQLEAVPAAVGGDVTTIKADVTKPEDWAKLKSMVDADFGGKINLLALNAGIGRPTSWEDPANFKAILDVNLWGVIHGITTFLPAVKAAAATGARSSVVITGSKQGITNPPGNPAYNASKAAVKTLAEHLSFDLRNESNLTVHLLVPGWTFTALTGNKPGAGKEKPAGAWFPEQVVDYLEEKMAEGKFYVLCPDNDVAEETDKKRMLWSVGDLVEGRPPLTRWRDEWKGKAQEWMDSQKL